MTTDRINQIECRRLARVARVTEAALSLSFSKSARLRDLTWRRATRMRGCVVVTDRSPTAEGSASARPVPCSIHWRSVLRER